jgi:hypothetical protein
MDPAAVADLPPSRRIVAWLRRSWPWLVGLVILALVATRIPLDAFRAAIGHGPHLLLAVVNLGMMLVILGTDSISTWIGLVALRARRPFGAVVAVRGATYVLLLVNYALGQGGFGYYLHKTGVPALRAVGVTLFLIGTNLATMLLITTAAFALHGPAAQPVLWWTLVGLDIAFVAYLVVIAWAPRWLAERQILAPLFDAGLRGHALAMCGRVPHTVAIVLGQWIAIRVWHIPVPFGVGMTLMPAVAIISVLPISPAGLGTTQAAFVYFFSRYAAGATTDQRGAVVLAFAVIYFVYGVLSSLAVGLVCAPFARRIRARVESLSVASGAPATPASRR